MLGLDKEVCGVAALPTDERVAGLKRIIPRKTVQAVLDRTHPDQRFCKRLPRIFVVWFIIGLALQGKIGMALT